MFIPIFLLISLITLICFFITNRKNFSIILFSTIFIFYFILNPQISIDSTLNGGLLFITAVFPSLFPFIFFSNLLIENDGIQFYEKIFGKFISKFFKLPSNCVFPLIISILCGYPLGAKYSTDLYEKKCIDQNTYKRLLYIASNPSPLFVIGFLGISIFNNTSIGYLLLTSCYLSCIIIAIFTSRNSNLDTSKLLLLRSSSSKSFGESFKKSLDNALSTSFSIGSYVIIFSVIIGIIKNNVLFNIAFNNYINIPFLKVIFLGSIEITNGASLIKNLLNLYPIYFLVPLTSFLLGFSGLSIISQVQSFTFKHRFIKNSSYILIKFIQGVMCSIISFIILMCDKFNFLTSIKNITTDDFNYSLLVYATLIFLSIPVFYKVLSKK